VTKELDLLDIQGNVVRAYGRYNYPFARYVFLHIREGRGIDGRAFVGALTTRVTTAVNWGEGPDPIAKPAVATNVAFTYQGLKRLELPRASLNGFPSEFIMGMKPRKKILGDDGPSDPEHWDPIWRNEKDIHVLVSLNGQSLAGLDQAWQWLLGMVEASAGAVLVLKGHRGENGAEDLPYQEASAVFENGVATSKEHFGYTDGIGDPVFEGLPEQAYRVHGRGKQTRKGWAPLATGEFLLGHTDEAREYPRAPAPLLLARNGTFMVYRKLHENVGSFNRYLDQESKTYPGGRELLAAKFVGRWRDNGAPLAHAPDERTKKEWDQRFARAGEEERDRMLSDWTYNDDKVGAKCPFSSHMRRINPRGSLELTKDAFDTPGALANRRRVIRRGLPYGGVKDPARDDGNHGIIIMMLNADIARQFEFVQQQWINYGNDFHAANDKEIILGNHCPMQPSKAVLPVPPDSDQPPYFLRNIPRLVETRGGEYFFIPSMTALRMIAKGTVDPT
jgi:deferrochelatase/peroxidase EfeB